MTGNITSDMIKLLNQGDKKELHAFLLLYARPIYERALTITGNDADAKRVTRRAITETALLAVKGELKDDIDAQLMALTDACCSEDLFFEKLVDDTMKELNTATGEPLLNEERLQYDKPSGRTAAPAAPTAAYSQQAAPPARPAAPTAAYSQQAAPPVQLASQTAAYSQQAAPQARPAAQAADYYVQPQHGDEDYESPYAKPGANEDGKYRDGALPDLFDDEESGNNEDDWDDDDSRDNRKAGPLLVMLIFILSLITVFLVWVLLVKLMYVGVIPKFDFGFADWFNTNIFSLY